MNSLFKCFFLCFLPLLSPATFASEDLDHDQGDHLGHGHTDALHFLHPLVTESPLPENEARLQFQFDNLAGDGGQSISLIGTVEFAPVRWFSVEASLPLTHVDPEAGSSETRVGDAGLGFKFASFAYEEQGILLSAGLELGLPTGNEERGIGSDHVVELEPWIGLGLKCEHLEWIVRIGAGFPLNQNGDREADVEIEWSTSLLFHIVEDRFAALIELDGLSIFGEAEDGFNNVSVTPGVRVFPFENPDVSLGFGIRLPLTNDRESHAQGIFTLYFHF